MNNTTHEIYHVQMRSFLLAFLIMPVIVGCSMSAANEAGEIRVRKAEARTTPILEEILNPIGAKIGDSIFLRAVKESSSLELWVDPKGSGSYICVKQYRIAAWSGNLGPKEQEGDGQTPEGFYNVTPRSLNPNSKYHLSFNIGYPNSYDLALGRTGSFIMVHGSDVSIGCLAMTDEGIEEIYTMVARALSNGQKSIPIHIYPFVPTEERMKQEINSPYYSFWEMLRKAWDWTERYHLPPDVQWDGKDLIIRES
jgi:murein L,D-transpeptidase YafK